MTRKKDQSVSSEVKSRLEELFSEENESGGGHIFEETEKPPNTVLRSLKAVVLSIDWEINDETMSALMDQIALLKNIYRQDRILFLFLQLLSNLGIYIKTKKANAHPDSIKLLNSAYLSFEKAVMDTKLSESDRKKLLQTEVGRFIDLKERVALKKEFHTNKPDHKTTSKQLEAEKSGLPAELSAVVEEIKTMIRAEFRDLKAELKTWMSKRP